MKTKRKKRAKSKQVALPIRRVVWGPNEVRHWTKALPFFFNHRGLLVHRVHSALTFLNAKGEDRHSSIHYFCGNGGCLDYGELLADPGKRLICARCEFLAQSNRKPSADQIVGRHCHVGRIRVEQTCCTKHRESN